MAQPVRIMDAMLMTGADLRRWATQMLVPTCGLAFVPRLQSAVDICADVQYETTSDLAEYAPVFRLVG